MQVVEPARLCAPACRDADDDNVLATAFNSDCDCIVIGNKDLLVLQRFGEINIVKPGDFSEYEARNWRFSWIHTCK